VCGREHRWGQRTSVRASALCFAAQVKSETAPNSAFHLCECKHPCTALVRPRPLAHAPSAARLGLRGSVSISQVVLTEGSRRLSDRARLVPVKAAPQARTGKSELLRTA